MSPTAPSDDERLRLTAQISTPTISSGQVATLTFRLENVGSETVNVNFNSTCQVLPYIRERSSNRIVYPDGGQWVCAAAFTQISLRPGGADVREVRVRGIDTQGAADATLSPGAYEAFARLDDTRFRLVSETVTFVVQ